MYMTIPVPTYVKKFLTQKYGEALFISKKTTLGIHLLELLEKEFDPKSIYPVLGNDCYRINLSEYYANTKGVVINPMRANDIANYLDRLFREQLFDFMKIHKYQHGQELPAIRIFLDYHGITEDDLKYDSIYRDYKRYKKKEERTKILKLSQPL